MPKMINDNCYYTIHEVCSQLGISKSTLSRWIKRDPNYDARYRDRNGWRLYSEEEIERLDKEYNKLYSRSI